MASLSSLRALLGTPWEPDWRGAILVWEDVGRRTDYLDMVLTHFRDCGVFDQIAGMVVGELAECTAVADRTVDDMLADLFDEHSFPIASGLAFGHTSLKHTIPIGGRIVMDGASGTLRLRAPWVAARERT